MAQTDFSDLNSLDNQLLGAALNAIEARLESVSSGEKTTSVLLDTGAGTLCGVVINTDGSNNATIILYDSLTAANTKIHEQVVLAADITGGFVPWPSIAYTTGLYLSIAGTGASAIVSYISK